MHPLVELLFRGTLIFVIAFVIVQPFSMFCNLTRKCQPFYFSYYFPKSEGKKPIHLTFEIDSQRGDIDLIPLEPILTTVTGRKNTIAYRATNLTNHPIRFRPIFYTNPEEFERYITQYDCLCFHEHKLNVGETIVLETRFETKKKVEESDFFSTEDSDNKEIKMGYKLR